MPNHGIALEPVPDIMSGIAGAVPDQGQQQALLQVIQGMDPQAQQQLLQGLGVGTSPVPTPGPVRIERPRLPGDRDIQ